MTMRMPGLALCVMLVAGGIANVALAQAVDTRCIRDGGAALCVEPEIAPVSPDFFHDSEMWEYNLCDMRGPYLARSRAWCEARGGTWGTDGLCTSIQPLFEPAIVPVSRAFEVEVYNACQIGWADTGWGQSIPSNILCWTGGPLYQNGTLIRDFRTLNFTGLAPSSTGCDAAWTETVHAGKWRKLTCPMGYNQRTRANGDIECWKLPVECRTVGNPVNLLDGCKMQDEIDYRSRAPGGLAVERYYNSAGYFRVEAAPVRSSDVWRTNWDRRILVPPVGTAVMAYAQRPEGTVLAFLSSGREMHNLAGGASATLERVSSGSAAWKLTTGERDVELYDGAGRLHSVTSRTGLTHTLTYDAGDRLASVTDSFGVTISFTYDANGRLGGFVAPANRVSSYGYDADGRLISVTYPDGTVRTYHYEDANWRHGLTGVTDESGQRFATWTYDAAGHANSSQRAGGVEAVSLNVGGFDPTANSGAATVVDGFGTRYVYSYKAVGGVLRISKVSRPCPNCSGDTASYTFDANGNVASHKDFNGNLTIYAYDLARNLETSRTEAYGTAIARTIATQWHPVFRLPTKITAPSGIAGVNEVTDLAYDAQGNVVQKTVTAGSRSRQWTYTYNALGQRLTVDGPRTDVADIAAYTYYGTADPCVACRGNVRTITNAAGHVTTFDAYDVDGQPTRFTDPNGVVTAMTYDLRGRPKTRVTHIGSSMAETTAFDYDARGLLVGTALADGSHVRYQYDAARRLTETTDGLGNVIQYKLDAMGNRIKEDVYDPSDALVRTRQRTYDALNRLFSDIGAADQLSSYAYDGNGNLRAATDALGRVTTRTYDGLNRQATSTDPAGGVVQYGYDAKDRLVSVKDPINSTTTYTYNGLGDLVQLNSPDTGATTYGTDANGNVTSSTDARGLTTTYTYDLLGRQTAASFSDGGIAFEYDNTAIGGAYAKGRLTRMTDPSGSTSYVYDAWGRVLARTQSIGVGVGARTFAVFYQYANSRMTGMTYPSGRTLTYQYDAQGQIVALTFGGQPILGGATYQPFGAVQRWTWGNGQTYRRSFDHDGRIASVTLGPDTESYPDESWNFGYDALDRLTSASTPLPESFAYSYDANGNRNQEIRNGADTRYAYFPGSNRLQSLSGAVTKSFAYDASGNMTGRGDLTFGYDARGRLTQAGNGYTYQINGLGQRVAKSGPGVATGTNYFVYDEQGRLIGEYDAVGAPREELIYVSDTPVATVRPTTGGGVEVYFIYSDHLNSPRMITNHANRVVWEWRIDTFGAGAPNENPSGLGGFVFNLRFPGQYFDAETNTHYNYFRDYDPALGRYEQVDPIGLAGGMNTYSYVRANAIVRSDPTGLYGLPWEPPPRWAPPGFPPPPPGNGNKRPGFEVQDGICSIGGAIANDFGCIRQCCVEHDECYALYQCNQSSWAGPWSSACQECNRTFMACFARRPRNGCQQGCDTTFNGGP